MSAETLFQYIFEDFASVIGEHPGTDTIKLDSAELSAGWNHIKQLFSDLYGTISFPPASELPVGVSKIETDISTEVSKLKSSNAITVTIGVTSDHTKLEYVKFSFALDKTYSFDVPGTQEQVSIANPTLTVSMHNPASDSGSAQADISLVLSADITFLGVDAALQLSLPDFVASINAKSNVEIGTILSKFSNPDNPLDKLISNSSTLDATLSATIDIKDKQLEHLTLSVTENPSCSWCGFTLKELSLVLSSTSTKPTSSVAAQLQISDGNHSADVNVTLTDDGKGGFTVNGSGDLKPALDVAGVATNLASQTGVNPPTIPFDLSLASLGLKMSETDKKLASATFTCAADLLLQDSGSSIRLDATIDYSSADNNLTITLGIGEFILTDISDSDLSVYSATITENSTLSIQELAQFFNLEALANLRAAKDITVSGLFLASGSGDPKPHVIGLKLDIKGASIQEELLTFVTDSDTIGLDSITVFGANQKWSASDISKLSGVTALSGFDFPSEIPQGPALFVSVMSGGKTYNLPIISSEQGGTQSSSQGAPSAGSPSPSSGQTPTQPAPITDKNSVRWFDVQEQMGPLFVSKLGFKMQNQNNESMLELATDSSITIGPLDATLDGFSFTLPFKPLQDISVSDLSVGLQGFSLSYSKPPVDISGGLLHSTQSGKDIFQGNVLVETGTFLLSAYGEYADVTIAGDQFKSLALFAALNNPPLGGPACCFITGLAAGFGYNSQLNIPTTPAQVQNFPLLTAAGPIPAGGKAPDITTITKCISPSAGEDWVAVGILFNSYEFIHSTVLLTAAFGHELQFAILGQSEMSLPPDSDEDLAFAQIDIEATYAPASGYLGVFGILTNNSYILSQDCHLTGGFAYVLKNNGDFVLSFGGYAPHYNYQKHSYPAIPRIQMLWQVDSHTHIKGDEYFAITPAVMMAGGGLEATWNSGIFSAWFNVNVDLFMKWRPFAYSGDFSMQLGVGFNLHVCFVHIHYSFQLGAQIAIEGPPFRGSAHIDLDVVSFTIDFGPSSSTPPPLTWDQFRKILPPGGKPVVSTGMNNDTTIHESDSPMVTANITSGLLLDLSQSKASGNNPDWVINGTSFCVEFLCNAPVTALASGGSIDKATLPTIGVGTEMGVLPMGIAKASGALQITVKDSANQLVDISGNKKFNIDFTQKKMATAHWGQEKPQNSNSPSMTMNQGCRISALRGTPDETKLIPVSRLQNTPQVTACSNRSASNNPFVQN